jgi:hypothetical protein
MLLVLRELREAAKTGVLPKLRTHRCWHPSAREADIAIRGRGEGRRKERS